MYDLLRCTQEWSIPYSQIYVEGELCCTNNSKATHYRQKETIIHLQFKMWMSFFCIESRASTFHLWCFKLPGQPFFYVSFLPQWTKTGKRVATWPQNNVNQNNSRALTEAISGEVIVTLKLNVSACVFQELPSILNVKPTVISMLWTAAGWTNSLLNPHSDPGKATKSYEC